jgi:hypothetical protein
MNIVLPSMPRSSKWSLSLRFPHQNPVYTSPLPLWCYMMYSFTLFLTSALLPSEVLSCPSGEVYTGFWWRNLRERDHLGDLGVEGNIILNRSLRYRFVEARSGLIWLIIETGVGLL